ncbi:GtrA family protein [Oryzicola mucosus]|uniref:GtrA family protein n=1 Tax=Oryzicola mucosus TaxID=2767425 RepID=A0A8J6PIC7_9HYPH|nr:GtrA family protein [Oryzicola mucosus]MBD0414648.1 GtrA family protein [Oryzicola mucosus]
MTAEGPAGRSLVSKLVRFAIVGFANTGIDLAAFSLFLWLGMAPLMANVLAWAVAVVFSFAANSFWSFERDRTLGLISSFLRFVSLGALISLGVSNLSLIALTSTLGVWPAKIIGVVAAAILNFVAARWSIESRIGR